jgi:hypothetical protein
VRCQSAAEFTSEKKREQATKALRHKIFYKPLFNTGKQHCKCDGSHAVTVFATFG